MPVVTSVKRGSELARRCHVRIAVQYMTDFVRILLLNARQRQFCEPFCCSRIKLWSRTFADKRARVYQSNQCDDNPDSLLHRVACCSQSENGASRGTESEELP